MSQPDPGVDEGVVSEAARWCMMMAQSDLSGAEQQQFELWVSADPRHARALGDAMAAWEATRRQAWRPAMIALRREALADVRRAQSQGRWRSWGKPARVAVAATLLVAAGAAGATFVPRSTTYTTGLGERHVVVLEDGSRLSLDALTRVKVLYTADRRRLWLKSGRVKFDVARNPLRPFTVAANGRLVVATGTQFSVELVQRQVRVDLYEGHVTIMSDQEAHGGALAGNDRLAGVRSQNLSPGQELVAAKPDELGVVRSLARTDAPVWEGGQLVFTDERLEAVAERANRYSDQKIVLADQATGAEKISGVFAAGDTDALIGAITAILPVRASRKDGTVTLSKTEP